MTTWQAYIESLVYWLVYVKFPDGTVLPLRVLAADEEEAKRSAASYNHHAVKEVLSVEKHPQQ